MTPILYFILGGGEICRGNDNNSASEILSVKGYRGASPVRFDG
jgi:hypothetical protein